MMCSSETWSLEFVLKSGEAASRSSATCVRPTVLFFCILENSVNVTLLLLITLSKLVLSPSSASDSKTPWQVRLPKAVALPARTRNVLVSFRSVEAPFTTVIGAVRERSSYAFGQKHLAAVSVEALSPLLAHLKVKKAHPGFPLHIWSRPLGGEGQPLTSPSLHDPRWPQEFPDSPKLS